MVTVVPRRMLSTTVYVIQFNESGGISSSVKNIIKHSTPKDFGVSNGKSLPEYMW